MQAIIEQKLKQLPPNLHEEVIDFIDFLISKKVSKRKKKPKLDWIGGLKEYRNQYTSIELQKKALDLSSRFFSPREAYDVKEWRK